MLLKELTSPDRKTYVNPYMLYSQDRGELERTQEGLHLKHFSKYITQNLLAYAEGFATVWTFPRADRGVKALFRVAYTMQRKKINLHEANAKHRRKQPSGGRKITHRPVKKRGPKPDNLYAMIGEAHKKRGWNGIKKTCGNRKQTDPDII